MTITTPPAPGQLRRLVSIAAIAEALDVDIRHVRRLVYERRIPFIKWGHLLRFDPGEVQAWIDRYRKQPRLPPTDV